jgi:hypothetical protein
MMGIFIAPNSPNTGFPKGLKVDEEIKLQLFPQEGW